MNKLEIEMERRRVLHNKENTEKTIQILNSIEFNKKCMELYKNSDFDKIKRLLIENINLYNQLSYFRQIQKYKPFKSEGIKKEVLENDYDDYVSRDTTIETFDMD
jgi:hypothetical protein